MEVPSFDFDAEDTPAAEATSLESEQYSDLTLQPHRQRTSQACNKCRDRKTKCSGERPVCARCMGRGLVCEYSERESRPLRPQTSRSRVSPLPLRKASPTEGSNHKRSRSTHMDSASPYPRSPLHLKDHRHPRLHDSESYRSQPSSQSTTPIRDSFPNHIKFELDAGQLHRREHSQSGHFGDHYGHPRLSQLSRQGSLRRTHSNPNLLAPNGIGPVNENVHRRPKPNLTLGNLRMPPSMPVFPQAPATAGGWTQAQMLGFGGYRNAGEFSPSFSPYSPGHGYGDFQSPTSVAEDGSRDYFSHCPTVNALADNLDQISAPSQVERLHPGVHTAFQTSNRHSLPPLHSTTHFSSPSFDSSLSSGSSDGARPPSTPPAFELSAGTTESGLFSFPASPLLHSPGMFDSYASDLTAEVLTTDTSEFNPFTLPSTTPLKDTQEWEWLTNSSQNFEWSQVGQDLSQNQPDSAFMNISPPNSQFEWDITQAWENQLQAL